MTTLDLDAACKTTTRSLGGSCSGHHVWFDFVCALITVVWVLWKAIIAVGLVAVVPKITLLQTCVLVTLGTVRPSTI